MINKSLTNTLQNSYNCMNKKGESNVISDSQPSLTHML